ncbi:U-box domain-containing protein 19-like [Salvia miltiorrhiza]|uniref:U-box domain-containing protein 19-like n=1 Tax=Salvia miltiorrhiza TaxID=226208 RepID=UPI0025AC4692|nr:U-box domain-containing protein 19-like [Salvia miltiorrhiza]
MIRKFDRHSRRILKFPVVHPCEGISPATLLESLITLSHDICDFQFKPLASQRRNARETLRQISILSLFFEEIREHAPSMSDSIILCLSELHVTLQRIQLLLSDCARDGAKMLILMRSHSVATQFRSLIRTIATALDVLPLDAIRVPGDIKEVVEMLRKQARRARMEVDAADEAATKRVLLVLNQFENRFEPDPFMIRRVLGYLHINSWLECHKEIRFLEDEICAGYLDGDEREVPLLSSLIGLLSYCRGVLFEDYDVEVINQSDARGSNVEVLNCLNPEDFRCPISLELMTDPVTVATGQTYDRVSIQKWLKSGNFVCPKTGEKLTSTELVPNTSLKKLIQQFCAEYGVSMAKSSKNNRDISRTILPGSPANAAAVKFLSEYLTLSLGYGNDRQKSKAAYEIRLLAKSNLFNRCCLIESGSIPPLLELLDSTDPTMQENAVSALLKLSKQPRGQKSIIENGGLNSVLAVLKHGQKPESKQIAAAIIFYLASIHEQRKKIGENKETIPSLLELIRHGNPCGKKNAVVALFALLFYHRNRDRAIAAGAVATLLGLLESSDRAEVKTDTLAVLSRLADSFDGSAQIMEAAIPSILRLLYAIETQAGKEYCVSILHSLCLNCGADVVSVLVRDASLMTALYSLVTEGTSHAGRKARSLIKILHRFCETRSSDHKRELRPEQDQFVDVW